MRPCHGRDPTIATIAWGAGGGSLGSLPKGAFRDIRGTVSAPPRIADRRSIPVRSRMEMGSLRIARHTPCQPDPPRGEWTVRAVRFPDDLQHDRPNHDPVNHRRRQLRI